jgi:hypothetical protein
MVDAKVGEGKPVPVNAWINGMRRSAE